MFSLDLYETLVTPTCPEEEEMAISFSGFLREIELAQNCVQSPFIPFVVPYLRHLGETRRSGTSEPESNDQYIRILHFPKASVSELQVMLLVSRMCSQLKRFVQSKHLYFVGMSDRKFPGRIRRLGIEFPADLMEDVKHSQTRKEFLEERQYTMYNALSMAADSISISFAQNVVPSAEKEKPSRYAKNRIRSTTSLTSCEQHLRADLAIQSVSSTDCTIQSFKRSSSCDDIKTSGIQGVLPARSLVILSDRRVSTMPSSILSSSSAQPLYG